MIRSLLALFSVLLVIVATDFSAADESAVKPFARVAVLGNSLTLHGPAPDIDWHGNFGMAASSEERDFVHLLQARMGSAFGTKPELFVRNIADFERNHQTYEVDKNLQELADFRPDLIIFAIGENVSPIQDEKGELLYQASCKRLFQFASKLQPRAIVVRGTFWNDPAKNRAMHSAADSVGAIFISLEGLDQDVANFAKSEKEFKHEGVAGHPGDRGMFQIAEKIWSGIVDAKLAPAIPIRHSLLIAGPQFTGILDEEGNEVWKAERTGARDAYVLPNGNVLITWGDVIKEFERPTNKVVFEYRLSKENSEIGTAQRLANGNTLVTELGKAPVLLEVSPAGEIGVRCPLQPETDNAHMQTRMARKLSNGNYLVPHLLAFQVKEYAPDGSIVRSIKTDLPELGGREAENWPFTAIRRDNGNTLINLTHGNKTIEVDEAGKVVWMISNSDFAEKPFVDPCGGQLLPNGNFVVASYGANSGIKIFEVNREKKLVWSYSGYRAHELQVLSTNGMLIPSQPMK